MKPAEVTVEWLQAQTFDVRRADPPAIDGVLLRHLSPIIDGRGEVTELWSEPWTEDGFVRGAHLYQSGTDHGVVKCWHLHDEHVDQFMVTRGKLQVCLVDLREGSSTYLVATPLIIGIQNPALVKIPPGIMHGWKALSAPEVIVYNFQSHVYDAADEWKFPWDCVLEDLWEPRNG